MNGNLRNVNKKFCHALEVCTIKFLFQLALPISACTLRGYFERLGSWEAVSYFSNGREKLSEYLSDNI